MTPRSVMQECLIMSAGAYQPNNDLRHLVGFFFSFLRCSSFCSSCSSCSCLSTLSLNALSFSLHLGSSSFLFLVPHTESLVLVGAQRHKGASKGNKSEMHHLTLCRLLGSSCLLSSDLCSFPGRRIQCSLLGSSCLLFLFFLSSLLSSSRFLLLLSCHRLCISLCFCFCSFFLLGTSKHLSLTDTGFSIAFMTSRSVYEGPPTYWKAHKSTSAFAFAFAAAAASASALRLASAAAASWVHMIG